MLLLADVHLHVTETTAPCADLHRVQLQHLSLLPTNMHMALQATVDAHCTIRAGLNGLQLGGKVLRLSWGRHQARAAAAATAAMAPSPMMAAAAAAAGPQPPSPAACTTPCIHHMLS